MEGFRDGVIDVGVFLEFVKMDVISEGVGWAGFALFLELVEEFRGFLFVFEEVGECCEEACGCEYGCVYHE